MTHRTCKIQTHGRELCHAYYTNRVADFLYTTLKIQCFCYILHKSYTPPYTPRRGV